MAVTKPADMTFREQSLFRSGVYTVAASVIQVLAGLIGVIALARSLAPSEKGAYDLYWTSANMAVMLLGLSVPAGITYIVARRTARLTFLVTSVPLFAAGIAALTFALGTAVSTNPLTKRFLPIEHARLFPISLTAAGIVLFSCYRGILVGQRDFRAVSVADSLRSVLGVTALLTASAYLSLAEGVSRDAMIWGNTLAVLVGALFYIRSLHRSVDGSAAPTAMLSAIVAYAAPTYTANLVQYLNYRADVFLLSGLSGLKEVGIYQVAVMLAELLRVLPAAAQSVLWPTIASRQHQVRESALLAARSARWIFLGTLVSAIILALIASAAVPVVMGQGYARAVPAIYLLVPGISAFSLCTVLAGYLAGIGAPRLNLYASVVGLIVTLGLDPLLIPRYGLLAAAAVSSLSYTTSAIFTVWQFSRQTKLRVRLLLVPAFDDIRSLAQLRHEVAGIVRRKSRNPSR